MSFSDATDQAEETEHNDVVECGSDEPSCPTQEDIWEGICIVPKVLEFPQAGGRPAMRAEGYVALYERKELARAILWSGLFKKIDDQMERLCYPRIFTVNDHGNVTEYAHTGGVIGSWV